MEFSGWDESYSVGHPRMDEDHRKLFRVIADLKQAMASNDVLQEFNAEWEVAERLVDYAGIHLAEEEAVMAAVGYPDLDRHRELHRFFMSKVVELEEGMRVGGETPSLEKLCGFLENWLASHILGEDQKYQPYVKGTAIPVPSLALPDDVSSSVGVKLTNVRMTVVCNPHGKHLCAPAVCLDGERTVHYDHGPAEQAVQAARN